MKKMLGLIGLFFCVQSFSQTYIENQFSGLQDANAWIKKLRVDSSIKVLPVIVPTGTNVFAPAVYSFPNYNRTGPASFVNPFQAADAVAGTYNNIPTSGGSGTGLTVNITVPAPTTNLVTVTIANPGTGYKAGDIVTIPRTTLGSAASTTYGMSIYDITQANNFENRSLPFYAETYLSKFGTAGSFTGLFGGRVLRPDGSVFGEDYRIGLYSITGSDIRIGHLLNGVYTMGLTSSGVNIPNLNGVTATITTINSTVSNGQIYTSNAGSYQANGTSGQTSAFVSGQVKTVSGAAFTANQTNTSGAVATLTITNGGSGYTPGTYSSIATTNVTGTGSGLFISITVNGSGIVSAISINTNAHGIGYVAGSTISSTVIPGSGTGFQATIATLANRALTAFRETSTFTSTSGDNYYGANFTPIINQAGTATGNVYGFYWNPTLTSLLGTHNAIHTVTGNVLLATTSGNVGIGTTDTKGYKLAVAGSAVVERLVVKKQSSWPDYVFDSSYQLASLYQVERYIQQNKHLPDVPSAAEVKKEGLDLGNSQAVLLRKIEELTLYIIEQNKQVENQKRQLETQKQANAALENRLSEIERKLAAQVK